MPLTFVKTKIVKRKVEFNVPKEGEGYDQLHAFVTFEIQPDDGKPNNYDRPFMKRVVKSIDGVQDESGQEIKSSPEFIDDFMSVQYLMAGLVREYVRLTIGAGRGN